MAVVGKRLDPIKLTNRVRFGLLRMGFSAEADTLRRSAVNIEIVRRRFCSKKEVIGSFSEELYRPVFRLSR